MELVFCLMFTPVSSWICGGFSIFDNFTTEPIRITMLLNDFLCSEFRTDFLESLFSSIDRIFNIGNMLLEVFVVQQIIF